MQETGLQTLINYMFFNNIYLSDEQREIYNELVVIDKERSNYDIELND